MSDIEIESHGSTVDNDSCADSIDLKARHTNTLGSVQLRNPITNDIILVPTPSKDPNDPLNWYDHHKIPIASLLSTGI